MQGIQWWPQELLTSADHGLRVSKVWCGRDRGREEWESEREWEGESEREWGRVEEKERGREDEQCEPFSFARKTLEIEIGWEDVVSLYCQFVPKQKDGARCGKKLQLATTTSSGTAKQTERQAKRPINLKMWQELHKKVLESSNTHFGRPIARLLLSLSLSR